MGVSCGPTLANIVVYMMEKNWVSIHKPLIYRRFIDDIVMIVNNFIDIDKFKSNFGKLKLNLVFGHEIQFLDLKIIFDRVFRRIRASLYIKPTNTFSYLSIDSNHKQSVFKNIPISLFIRVRRICSETIDYFYFSRLLIFQLMERGYKFYFLLNIARKIFEKDRNNFLSYKTKLNSFGNFSSFFVMPSHQNPKNSGYWMWGWMPPPTLTSTSNIP